MIETPIITIESDMLGAVDVSPQNMIEMPAGMFGFPECRSFALLPAEKEGLFWLQSAEYAALAFVLIDPFLYFPEYEVNLHASEQNELRIANQADLAILAVVTLPRTPAGKPTANLQGPLAINLRERVGRQVALSSEEYEVRQIFDLLT